MPDFTDFKKKRRIRILLEVLSIASLCFAMWLCIFYKGSNHSGLIFTTQLTAAVTTHDITEITCDGALCKGEVTSENGRNVTQRGVCWSTNPNPTLSDSCTIDGDSIGQFTSTLRGLIADTKYYVRAYAKNGAGTSFGQEKSFTTPPEEVGGPNLTLTVKDISFNMIYVEGGTFQMGAASEQGRAAGSYEKPAHSVTLSDYYIGETEVTQALWKAVMGSNPSGVKGEQRPVGKVSWYECQTFINKLNKALSSQLNGMQLSLPTEAEWEYAARGGKKSQGYKYSGSNTIGDVAWYDGNSKQTNLVAQKQANELGLYDMSGNVWEWCHDWSGNYPRGAQTNPSGPSSGSGRVYRGGSWISDSGCCRVSDRYSYHPSDSYDLLGLRLALR